MEEALIKRIMPNNLEAEQSVIGSGDGCADFCKY